MEKSGDTATKYEEEAELQQFCFLHSKRESTGKTWELTKKRNRIKAQANSEKKKTPGKKTLFIYDSRKCKDAGI